MPWRLFLVMFGLQSGEEIFFLAQPVHPVWRLETGGTSGKNMQKLEVHHISGMEQDSDEIPMPTPTFSWSRNSTVQLPILSHVTGSRKFKMAPPKPEVHHISGTEQDSDEIPTPNPTFSTTPDSLRLLPTLADVARHRTTIDNKNGGY